MTKEELSVKDLMINDWVNVVTEGEVYPSVVTKMERDTEDVKVAFLAVPGDWEEGDFFDEIQPIPLTDAILKANGFEYRHKNFAALSYEHPFQLEMVEWQDENGVGLWMVRGLLKIRYVHELQHALRLCGVDKELIVEG